MKDRPKTCHTLILQLQRHSEKTVPNFVVARTFIFFKDDFKLKQTDCKKKLGSH